MTILVIYESLFGRSHLTRAARAVLKARGDRYDREFRAYQREVVAEGRKAMKLVSHDL